uniref:Uncharacterized protein n=2 Tax=Ditylum brightwellii TaxID=49249 RepID=A0A7S4T8P3_9STRA|mmetsp:Transcript_3165/g.4316  ORF Transcript_3165/g.4316 Transcript_3165/m.4316 type:complete len:174 (+) Transcript_3165:83-604(+)
MAKCMERILGLVLIISVCLSLAGSYSCEFTNRAGFWNIQSENSKECYGFPKDWGATGSIKASRAFAILTTLSGVFLLFKGFFLLVIPRITAGATGKCFSALLFVQVLFEGLKFLGLNDLAGKSIGGGGGCQIAAVVVFFIALVMSCGLKDDDNDGDDGERGVEEPLLPEDEEA